MLSIVQLSRFFLCSFSSDSFYILSKALSFVKNFFNFFHFLFCEAFSQRVSSYIISFVSVFVKNFFDFFQKLFWYYFDTLFSCFPNYGLQFSPNIRQDFSRIKRRRRDLNPRAAINDLHPFQGCPFGLLGTSPSKLIQSTLRFDPLFIFVCLENHSVWFPQRLTLTERVGFEPTRPCGQTVFKTASLWPLRYLSICFLSNKTLGYSVSYLPCCL